ncbi:HAD family hydrolase [Georgenia phoenicis]|uniref:HAD family hydrolase n=1 Tax=unclassified Georgenia TaxID=2626815 RepID=UPI0039B0C74A
MGRTVIFDFDGTISLGDGPLDAYARCVARLAGSEALLGEVAAARALDAERPGTYRDGYHAVAAAAHAVGIDDATLSAGYLRSRELLGTDAAPVTAPRGLGAFLRRLAQDARLVLVTNAPAIRIPEALEALGADGAFDDVVCAAGKPAGLAAVIEQALAIGPVLSVGDIDEFDLAPARLLGADTALVGPAARVDAGRSTFAAERLDLLYADIAAWAAAPVPAPTTDTPARA